MGFNGVSKTFTEKSINDQLIAINGAFVPTVSFNGGLMDFNGVPKTFSEKSINDQLIAINGAPIPAVSFNGGLMDFNGVPKTFTEKSIHGGVRFYGASKVDSMENQCSRIHTPHVKQHKAAREQPCVLCFRRRSIVPIPLRVVLKRCRSRRCARYILGYGG